MDSLAYQGRLAVFHEGEWGTICHDAFETVDATVACRQMGYTEGAVIDVLVAADTNATIWLDNVECRGSEARLVECNHHGWNITNCGHHQDVFVSCQTR